MQYCLLSGLPFDTCSVMFVTSEGMESDISTASSSPPTDTSPRFRPFM